MFYAFIGEIKLFFDRIAVINSGIYRYVTFIFQKMLAKNHDETKFAPEMREVINKVKYKKEAFFTELAWYNI